MTRVPPVNQNQRSNQSGDGPDRSHHKKDKKKEFKLPDPKEAQGEVMQQAKLAARKAAEAEAARMEKTAGIDASKLTNVNTLIGKMVDSMQIGKVGGKDLLQAELKQTDDIPNAFKGATVKIEMSPDGLKVFIEPLPGQEDQAAALVQQHHEQTLELQQSLAAKGHVLQQLQVGAHVVDLPKERITPLSELFSGTQTGRDRGDRDRRGPDRVEPDRET